jgi:hypothetical protein
MESASGSTGWECARSSTNGPQETDLEKLAREVALRPARQTKPAKLARKVGIRPAGDNALVPDQKEHRDDALVV